MTNTLLALIALILFVGLWAVLHLLTGIYNALVGASAQIERMADEFVSDLEFAEIMEDFDVIE